MQEILKVENVRKMFKLSRKQQKIERSGASVKVAVDGLSFSSYEGEIFGLLGPNGAGKTTMLRILSTLIRADEGDVFVGGESVKTSPDKVRSQIGFMTGELKLESFFTPNYLFGFFAKLYGMSDEEALARKNELFTKFGIDEYAEVKVGDLSTGMRQKVSLVISIIHDPAIVVFDEPTNGLDVLTAKVVTDFLLELKAQGKSIVLSTHDFSLVEKLCDRVGIIIRGKMVACQPLKELCGGRSLEEVFFEIYEREAGRYDA